MISNKTRISVILCILLSLMIPTLAAGAVGELVLFEDFNDGDMTNNPTWDIMNDAYEIINGELHSDGLNTQDTRWQNSYRMDLVFETADYIEMQYVGMLKSTGNPQIGRGIAVRIYNTDPQVRQAYMLEMNRGFVDGHPKCKYCFSLAIAANHTAYSLISSSFKPEYDRVYHVRAVRENGIWSLFVDGQLIGTAADPLALNNFNYIWMTGTGSVVVDDIEIRMQPPSIPVSIDIRPGTFPNSINLKAANGVVPVAILSTDDFDALTVDHTTVLFGGAAAAIHGQNKNQRQPVRQEEDVDSDGDLDLVLHFQIEDIALTCETESVSLVGFTYDGDQISGEDSVKMVGCHP
jgi:hypothetical protein